MEFKVYTYKKRVDGDASSLVGSSLIRVCVWGEGSWIGFLSAHRAGSCGCAGCLAWNFAEWPMQSGSRRYLLNIHNPVKNFLPSKVISCNMTTSSLVALRSGGEITTDGSNYR